MSDEKIREFFSCRPQRAADLREDLASSLASAAGDEQKTAEIAGLIVAQYSAGHRVYHNLSHVDALLENAENFKDQFADEEGVRLAVWFHDAVYEPRSASNEIESSRLAVESLAALNFPQEKIEKVEKMILATRTHDAAGLDADGELFLDLDLGILGADKNLYRRYAQAIREEYSFVPESLYRVKRREILESFLRREFIYYTAEMRASREEAARRNVANEIKELS
jgi:predicted metal-dependent HD superfamily phosphohydrolase